MKDIKAATMPPNTLVTFWHPRTQRQTLGRIVNTVTRGPSKGHFRVKPTVQRRHATITIRPSAIAIIHKEEKNDE